MIITKCVEWLSNNNNNNDILKSQMYVMHDEKCKSKLEQYRNNNNKTTNPKIIDRK